MRLLIFLGTFGVVTFIILVRSFTLMKRERDRKLKVESEHYQYFSSSESFGGRGWQRPN